MGNRVLGAALAVAVAGSSGCLSLGKLPPAVADGAEEKAPEKLELPAPEAAKACLATAQMLEAHGNLPEAATLYERARGLDPSLDSVGRRLAVLYDCQGAFVRADAEYRKALAVAPKDADLWNDYGYSLYCRGNWTDAETAFRKALAARPDHERAWINLGLTLAQAGKLEAAYGAFVMAVPAAQAHCNLGFALATQGKRAEALDEYRKALAIAPDLQLARVAVAKLSGAAERDADLDSGPATGPARKGPGPDPGKPRVEPPSVP